MCALKFVSGKPVKVPSPIHTPHAEVPIAAPIPNGVAEHVHPNTTYGKTTALLDAVEAKVEHEAAKVVAEKQVETAHSETLTSVDEYCEIQALIQKYNLSPLLKKQEELKKRLQLIAKSDHFESGKPVQLYGTCGNYVEFSAQANTTKIVDKEGLIAAMGQEAWNAYATITLADARKALSELELAKFTTEVPGARTMKAVVLGEKEE